MGMMEVGTA